MPNPSNLIRVVPAEGEERAGATPLHLSLLATARFSQTRTHAADQSVMAPRSSSHETASRVARAAAIWARLRTEHPRVQCLTNTVGQPITANVLLAAGADVSMATHPDEVIPMSASAGALLVNLGTLDVAREAAILRLLAEPALRAKPLVLDPVFVQHSPLRLALAKSVLAARPVIVKANADESRALAALHETATTWVTTGEVDRIRIEGGALAIHNGHAWMAAVTGLGCALGALIAALAAVTDEPSDAALAGLLALNVSGDIAAERSRGPGSFSVQLIDAVAQLTSATLADRARVSIESSAP
jgi:hydroxyethylthiazole kinase